MKVLLPVMIKDTMHSEYLGVPITENWEVRDEEFFLDGPVTRRVAVLDFEDRTGELSPPVKFLPPAGRQTRGRYAVPEKPAGLEAVLKPEFIRVCALAAVLRTMKMFEHPDTLGRRLTWAFAAPQLLVLPRAGRWENAFYERESQSLQFFFPRADQPEELVYTSLSNDIVAHETGHAILDGIAPDLYHAVTPQSLALHEAVADLVSVVMAFRSRTLSKAVLDKTRGTIEHSRAFSGIAEQFQYALRPFGEKHYLRDLFNDKTLDPRLPPGDRRRVARDRPHELSEVLSGALYVLVMRMHADRVNQYGGGKPATRFSASGKALAVAADHFKRMIFRALDYLPPGEVSFADYGRAILAADQALYPDRSTERDWLVQEFVQRHIVPDARALQVRTNFPVPELAGLELQTLVESDWAAYEFANTHRKLLGIPPGIHFHVRPRLVTTKTSYQDTGAGARPEPVRECLFKVSWDHKEKNRAGPGLPRARQITVGTTLAIDWQTRPARAKTHLARALLTSDYDNQEQRDDRDALLRRLHEEGTLRVGDTALGPDGRVLQSAVHAEVMDGLMRARGLARTLHIVGGERA
jgi:hypothetical protein